MYCIPYSINLFLDQWSFETGILNAHWSKIHLIKSYMALFDLAYDNQIFY